MCQDLYDKYRGVSPDKDPHEILVGVYKHIPTESGAITEHDMVKKPEISWEILLRTL